MARTPSNMIDLGSPFPKFQALDVSTKQIVQSSTLVEKCVSGASPGILVMFICNHCPFVKHIFNPLIQFANKTAENKIQVIAINSNDAVKYPEDSPELMLKEIRERNFKIPYLYDESQEVARSFKAACTPDFFLYDRKLTLVYRGQFDDSRPSTPTPVTGSDLELAVAHLIDGKPPVSNQKPSIGCNIKWKS
jgi:thiol-disulfide isomerase/thioredoxin